jgi:hypothetical protein
MHTVSIFITEVVMMGSREFIQGERKGQDEWASQNQGMGRKWSLPIESLHAGSYLAWLWILDVLMAWLCASVGP